MRDITSSSKHPRTHLKKDHRNKFIVSACLAGLRCTCKGESRPAKRIMALVRSGKAMSACPEMLGGLGVPRDESEIVLGDGSDVLQKRAKVLTIAGKDVTENFVKGAGAFLELAKTHKITNAILKSRSPSCGIGTIYDGSFSHSLKTGDGVTAALLRMHGIKLFTEKGGTDA
ncbi:MAG: DUF523 domain-containing protein [Candidatus Omnitrophica bacterium]|nr:DUF523 domain-containing protein [Candidatus Omnitrophota bacterium]